MPVTDEDGLDNRHLTTAFHKEKNTTLQVTC